MQDDTDWIDVGRRSLRLSGGVGRLAGRSADRTDRRLRPRRWHRRDGTHARALRGTAAGPQHEDRRHQQARSGGRARGGASRAGEARWLHRRHGQRTGLHLPADVQEDRIPAGRISVNRQARRRSGADACQAGRGSSPELVRVGAGAQEDAECLLDRTFGRRYDRSSRACCSSRNRPVCRSTRYRSRERRTPRRH